MKMIFRIYKSLTSKRFKRRTGPSETLKIKGKSWLKRTEPLVHLTRAQSNRGLLLAAVEISAHRALRIRKLLQKLRAGSKPRRVLSLVGSAKLVHKVSTDRVLKSWTLPTCSPKTKTHSKSRSSLTNGQLVPSNVKKILDSVDVNMFSLDKKEPFLKYLITLWISILEDSIFKFSRTNNKKTSRSLTSLSKCAKMLLMTMT